jgi:uncharacterized protein YprB with RNaseH-like and TPR domain
VAHSATLERLRAAVATHAAARPATPVPPELPPVEQILRGEWHETPHGPAFVRDEWYPLDHEHGALPLGAPLDSQPDALAQLLGREAPHASRLAFFDIETTGLAGGAGTYVFLAGFGSYEDGAFRLRQYFLADVAGERAMLAALAAEFARFAGVVTYNGRAFDMPCVQARMTMARVPFEGSTLAHFDLLHATRRLYRHRMPGCRLADAERRLLRLERYDDVPGWLIPSLYVDYARAGRASPLRAVFRHNAEDVLSLAGVLAAIAALVSDPAPGPDDAIAVARWWERAGDDIRAMALYRGALPWLEGEDDWGWAATRHARLCRRAGKRAEAAALWQALWRGGDAAAGLELAKHLEHHARDLPAAEELTRALLVRCPGPGRIALAHRLRRIERKLAPR